MDLLNWLLVTWLGVAALIFLFCHKLTEYWPSIRQWRVRSVEPRRSISMDELYHRRPIATVSGEGQQESSGESVDMVSRIEVSSPSRTTRQPPLPPEIRVTRTPSQQSAQRPTSLPLQSESAEWLNQFLAWFMCHYKGRSGLLDSWVKALNEAARKIATQFEFEVTFDEVHVIEDKTIPRLANFKTEKGPRDTLSIRGSFSLPAVTLNFTSTRKTNEKTLVSTYSAELQNLSSKVQVRLVCMDFELFCMMCFDGTPAVDIELQERNNPRVQEKVNTASLEQIIRKCLTNAIVNMTFLEEEKLLLKAEEQRAPSPAAASPSAVECANELLRRLSSAPSPMLTPGWQQQPSSSTEQYNRLLVKILRAESLQQINSFTQPYVIVELDEPAQKHNTSLASSISPNWQEHFLFDIDHEKSQELLFEIYGRSASFDPADVSGCQQKFLGLAIISIDEIKRSPVTRHELVLQPRPFIKDLVSGTLFVECLFVYASSQDHDDEFLLQEFEMHMKRYGGQITTAYANRDSDMLVLKIPDLDAAAAGLASESALADGRRKSSRRKLRLSPKSASASASPVPSSKSAGQAEQDVRGRRATRPSFFDDLKKKMSLRHPQRPKSCEPDTRQILSPTDFTYHPPRSTPSTTSVERPPSSQTEVGPGCSDIEFIDGEAEAASLRSTLVVEVIQNQMKQYFYIPNESMYTRKAKDTIKAGKKLHIFNNHTFVAVKLPSHTSCKVCSKPLKSTFCKQGYQCRDCRLMCHKRCYTMVAGISCPNSRLSMLEIQRLPAKS